MEPDANKRDIALNRASEVAAKGRAHAAEQNFSTEHVDAAIHEAIQYSRHRTGE